jgi:hypothetical protein
MRLPLLAAGYEQLTERHPGVVIGASEEENRSDTARSRALAALQTGARKAAARETGKQRRDVAEF